MRGARVRGWAAIDLLRFACAMMVVGYHYLLVLPLNPPPAAIGALGTLRLPAVYAGWAESGWIGVELFFVISGYVIACSAADSTPRAFLVRRAQRLLPAAWICATLTFACLILVHALPPATLIAQWIRAVSLWPVGDAIDPSYWTLGIECAFYLLVAARLRNGGDAARIESLAWWIGGISAGFWALMLAAGALDGNWSGERLAELLLLSHGCFFAIGILLHAIHQQGATRSRIAGLAIFAAAALLEIIACATDKAQVLGRPVAIGAPLAIFTIGIGVIAANLRVQPLLARLSPLSALLGLMTYPAYLLHQQFGAVVVGLAVPMGLSPEAALAAALGLTLGLSWAVVRLAEPPLREMLGAAARSLSARHALRPDIRPNPSR